MSASCGCMVMRLTPNGLCVSALVPAISASRSSGAIAPHAITPNPPAFDMAETRWRSETQPNDPYSIVPSAPRQSHQIGGAHDGTPGPNTQHVCHLLIEQKIKSTTN